MLSKPFRDRFREILPWKRKGYEVLSRYDSADVAEGDRQTLEQLRAHGANLTRDRHVIHYLYFPDDSQRAIAENVLQENGYTTRHGVDSGEVRPKSLIAERNGIVSEDVVQNERVLLTSIAEANDGEYDGWEASLD